METDKEIIQKILGKKAQIQTIRELKHPGNSLIKVFSLKNDKGKYLLKSYQEQKYTDQEIKNYNFFNKLSQIAIPVFTISSLLAISFKYPQWGLILNLIAQPFWLYSTWRAYKSAGQLGMFVNTVIMTLIIGFGIVNYWFI